MPHAFVPRKSGAHRLACLSLYRALLRQSSLFPARAVNDEAQQSPHNALFGIVRYRFRKDCQLISPTQIANGLKTGASLLDNLQACSAGSSTALVQLTKLLESTLSLASSTSAYRAKLAPAAPPVAKEITPKIAHIQAHASKANHSPQPGVKSVLERPLPLEEIPGRKRKIPYLVALQGIPFLRYSKPQSVALGRYLRQQRAWDTKKWSQKHAMDLMRTFADDEDDWDRLLEEQHGTVDGSVSTGQIAWDVPEYEQEQYHPGSWAYALRESSLEVGEQLRARTARRAVMGQQMWDVVVKERQLARQEKIQRRADRKTKSQAVAGDIEPQGLEESQA